MFLIPCCCQKEQTTITAYTSGKVMFQGSGAEAEAARWSNSADLSKQQMRTTRLLHPSLPADFSQWSVVGSDEVGNGSYFGPLVVCAVYASKDQLTRIESIRCQRLQNVD